MKNKTKELAISMPSAEAGNGIDLSAVKEAENGTLQTGEKEGFAAGSEEEKTAEFEALIKGRFKKQFAARVKGIIDRRLREVKKLKDTAERNARIVKSLLEKYNLPEDNTDELERVISTENIRTEKRPEEMENLLRRLIAENAYLRKMREEEARTLRRKNREESLRSQAEETKKKYPDFDFEKQLENKEFRRLLGLGVSVKNAYEVVNMESILENNSKNAEKSVVDSIRSKAVRPVENGAAGGGGILMAGNASALTKKEREELARRAARGEHITL